VVQVAAGYYHTVALHADGTVTAFGQDNYGQVGGATGLSGVVQVAAGGGHTVALHADGTVTAFGQDSYGQVSGAGSLTNVATEPTYTLSGITALPDGTPVSARLRAYHAETGKLVWEKTSSPVDGSYDFRLPRRWSAYVQCEYDTGHRPLVHGPITPPPEV
jgi:hypothetical protein